MATLVDIRVPQISREELFAFHESHFSHVSIADFGEKFTNLPEPTSEEQQIDGVEGREAELQAEAEVVDGEEYDPETSVRVTFTVADFAANFEDGEIPDDSEEAQENEKEKDTDKPRKKRRRKKHNTGNSSSRRNTHGNSGGEPKKPDLRKRTWDVVDTGLGSLDYDGAERDSNSMQSAPQRRRVQYGEDCK